MSVDQLLLLLLLVSLLQGMFLMLPAVLAVISGLYSPVMLCIFYCGCCCSCRRGNVWYSAWADLRPERLSKPCIHLLSCCCLCILVVCTHAAPLQQHCGVEYCRPALGQHSPALRDKAAHSTCSKWQ